MCVQRFINGVFGQRDRSSGVPGVGGGRPDVQGEDWQGFGSAVSSDRSVPGSTVQLLTTCIIIVEVHFDL